jgi:hypothetical protein
VLTKEDLTNLLKLLQRVDLKGSEAVAVAVLIQKLSKQLNETGNGDSPDAPK